MHVLGAAVDHAPATSRIEPKIDVPSVEQLLMGTEMFG
jgi:hypothetical protein